MTRPCRERQSYTGGCDFAARPALSAHNQRIYWSPTADPAVIGLIRTPACLATRGVRPLEGLVEMRDSPEGLHALHATGKATFQLLFLDGARSGDDLAAVVPMDLDALGRIEALTRFWRAWHGRPIRPDTRMTAQQRRRLRLMIQAADGRAHRASYRAIAIAIYGAARVVSDPWKTSPLRDTVIALVEDGLAMIGGGYRRLLRHRRRS